MQFAISVTEEGISNDICVNDEHPLKAFSPNEITEGGIEITQNFVTIMYIL